MVDQNHFTCSTDISRDGGRSWDPALFEMTMTKVDCSDCNRHRRPAIQLRRGDGEVGRTERNVFEHGPFHRSQTAATEGISRGYRNLR
jgi:hypothetical protein